LFQERYHKRSHATPKKFEHRRVQQMSTKIQQNQIIEWRRAKVMELLSKGESNQSEIARILQVDKSIISRDVYYLRQQAKDNIKKYIDERLPEEYEKCLVGLNSVTKEAWNTAQSTEDRREKIQALSLAKECYSMKLDLLTNATVVEDAIRFVSSNKFKDNLRSLGDNSEVYKGKSKEPDYDEDEDQLEAEETGETTLTTNQVF
jgi:hypothetical protein